MCDVNDFYVYSGNIAGLSGLAYYASLDDDPYVTLKDVVSVQYVSVIAWPFDFVRFYRYKQYIVTLDTN